jgi:hypothetical protein
MRIFLKFYHSLPINNTEGLHCREVIMTISAYQIDSVISAYSKQNRIKTGRFFLQGEADKKSPTEVVSISKQGIEEAEAYKKISHSLIDGILKEK